MCELILVSNNQVPQKDKSNNSQYGFCRIGGFQRVEIHLGVIGVRSGLPKVLIYIINERENWPPR